MTRRVLYHGLDGYEWIEIPAAVAAAIDRSPRQPPRYTPADRRRDSPVKAFANPRAKGYGGDDDTPWPFDIGRARVDGRYRAGIRNAIRADWTAQNWKYYATRLLKEILEDE